MSTSTLVSRLAQRAEQARLAPQPEQPAKRPPLYVWTLTQGTQEVPLATGEVCSDDLDLAQAACDKAAARLAAERGATITYTTPWGGDYFTRWTRTYDTDKGWRVSFDASVVAV